MAHDKKSWRTTKTNGPKRPATRLVWLFLFARPQLVILENTLE
jgi:hypothetical protein